MERRSNLHGSGVKDAQRACEWLFDAMVLHV